MVVKLINYSPKCRHLSSEKLLMTEGPTVGIKPLYPTRWTVQTEAMDVVIKQYTTVMEAMEEVHRTTHDEYGVKAGGVLAMLEQFYILFDLKLGYLLFSAAEETSKVLQAKGYICSRSSSAVKVT